jgi:hypothetical protein
MGQRWTPAIPIRGPSPQRSTAVRIRATVWSMCAPGPAYTRRRTTPHACDPPPTSHSAGHAASGGSLSLSHARRASRESCGCGGPAPESLTLTSFGEPRACYGLVQEWLGKAQNGRPTANRANHAIRVLMRFISRVHNTLYAMSPAESFVTAGLTTAHYSDGQMN